jgi:hypothetical protein
LRRKFGRNRESFARDVVEKSHIADVLGNRKMLWILNMMQKACEKCFFDENIFGAKKEDFLFESQKREHF